MTHVTRFLTVLALFAVVPAAPAQEMAAGHEGHETASHIAIAPEDLEWMPAPPLLPPGAQVAILEGDPTKAGPFTTRLRLPAGYRIPAHTHPVDARITVLSGRMGGAIGSTWDDAALRIVGPGGYLVIPAGAPHFETALEESIVQLNATGPWATTYVDPADDPRSQPAAASR